MDVRTAEDMRAGDHACAVPVSDEGLWELTSRFLARGLSGGEKVVYFDDGTSERVLDRLTEDRMPVAGALRSGQLQVVPADVTRGAFRSPVADVRSLLHSYVDGSVAQGWSGLRMTGQLSYGADSPGGVPLSDYDRALDEVVVERGLTALCLYDHTRYTDAQIEHMRGVHREELDAPAAYDDGLLRITQTGRNSARLAGEADHSNRPMIHRIIGEALDRALRAADSDTDIELNLASLRFLDVAGAVALVHAAEEFPSMHRLVLSDVRPAVLRVLDRCGAPFAAQLVVREARAHGAGGGS
ncbi:MEDS domain-containing protein [Pseudonocardia sp. WMMC193]|uniref:MEDS domain-containing protein n=1 Tax=Pseudonocardia sp. WMMC193 TaxID=2911965 RepID=UPI001F41C818|nr:MEDS domain-containing protein [Pseudonocardia sp. WMMC193]MCF7548846.1 MEDS domain-containing protein [Pseudonocardia sp. WMMC193]